jgi:hypothetical protein
MGKEGQEVIILLNSILMHKTFHGGFFLIQSCLDHQTMYSSTMGGGISTFPFFSFVMGIIDWLTTKT